MESDRPRKIVAVILSLLVALVPVVVRFPVAASTATTVCNTNVVSTVAITQDFNFNVLLHTCGTAIAGASAFTSTSHNVTIYCSAAFTSWPPGPDCSDIKVKSWNLQFSGQLNLTGVYSYSNKTLPKTSFPAESLSQRRSFAKTADFAFSNVTITFTDNPPGPNVYGPFTITVNSFVGTSPVFRIDWSDANNDGTVDRNDVNNASAYFGLKNSYWDFYGNGTVTILDVALVSSYYGFTFHLLYFPGQGCPAQSFNNPSCQPPNFNGSLSFISKGGVITGGSMNGTAVHPSWKDSCLIFPLPDQTYCNQHA